MTDFADKLRRRFRTPPAAPMDGTDEARLQRLGDSPMAAFLRRRWQRQQQRTARPKVVLPDGEDLRNRHGVCYLRQLRYPLDQTHGDVPLGLSLDGDLRRVAELAKDDDVADLDLDQCLFLDTETTGLSGGAGTVVFLCGLGWFDGDGVVVEQVFLRGFDEEAAALAHVEARLRRRPVLVTYVGKSFDRHRLATRMSIHRIDTGMLVARHLDLYYLSRRAWRERLDNVRLRTVEEQVLGFFREDDLPGAAAPAAWLDWLRDETGPVDRVFEHNRLDVLSLVALLGALGR